MHPLTLHCLLASALLATCAVPACQAAAFTVTATLTWTITSVQNLSTPGSTTGLSAVASLADQAIASFDVVTGDGVVLAGNGFAQTSLPASAGASAQFTWTLSGEASDGSVFSSRTLWSGLEVSNASGDAFSLGMRLDYQLDVAAAGDEAAASLLLEWFSGDFALSGLASLDAASTLPPVARLTGSVAHAFELAAFATDGLYADITASGVVEADPRATPVPLPGVASLVLATGLAGLARTPLRRRTQPGVT